MNSKQQQGFTLIELIAVIVLLGIIGTGVLSLIKTSVEGYNEVTRRVEIADIGRFAIERVSRELRNTLPGSVRVTALGTCLEFVPVVASTAYISLPLAAAGNTISVANFVNADSTNISRVAVYTLNAASVYGTATNSHMANVASINPAIGNIITITLAANNQFPLNSPQRKIYFVGQPVSFCVSGQQLNRYEGYGYNVSQPTSLLNGQLIAEFIQLNDSVAVQPFKYSAGTLQRNALVHLDFRFLVRNSVNEWARFRHDVSLRGTP